MKLKHAIDLHKGLTAFVVLGLMIAFDNFGTGPFVYLALHGTYGVLWVTKSRVFPDPAWEERVPLWKGAGTFGALLLYWVAPVILITSGAEPPPWLIGVAVAVNVFGVFLHFTSDAQKYYTLRVRRGLITDGFFARTRNPNYLGEIFIYVGFALLAMHWIPFAILAVFVGGIFLPNMIKKDRSISRYEEWDEYRSRARMLLPRVF